MSCALHCVSAQLLLCDVRPTDGGGDCRSCQSCERVATFHWCDLASLLRDGTWWQAPVPCVWLACYGVLEVLHYQRRLLLERLLLAVAM
jgi:hypothetical protein